MAPFAAFRLGPDMTDPAARWQSRPRLFAGLFVVLVVLALAAWFFELGGMVSPVTLKAHHAAVALWIAENRLLACLGYLALFATASGLALPGVIWLALAGGVLFGAPLALLLTATAATLGAVIAFLAVRHFFGDRVMENLGPTARRLAGALRTDAWTYLLALRLVPLVPFFMVNLIAAFASVRLKVFVLTTIIGILPKTAVVSLTGAGLGRVFDHGADLTLGDVFSTELMLALAGLACLLLASIPIRHRLGLNGRDPHKP